MKNIFILLVLSALGLDSYACSFKQVTFVRDFEMARLDHCTQLSDNQFQLKINAENRPINHSPWYAFQVKSKVAQAIAIAIEFEQEKPRYLPKMSVDGKNWQDIPFTVDDNKLIIKPSVSSNPIWIAGQELLGEKYYQQWLSQHATRNSTKLIRLGQSTQGRAIDALISKNDNNSEWLVLIGRQHPPEVTGALAMFPFASRLLSNDSLAKKFRQRFNLIIVPLLNPDGVAQGHWRHNINGIDLNRDWIEFSQAETRLVRDKLNAIVEQGGKLVMAVDFHSTQQDVFYTMPTDYGLHPKTLVVDWLKLLKQKTASSFVVRNKPGSSPGRGIFKQYFADTFGVHAITYEMGDNTNRMMISHVANQAALTLMETLLTTSPSDFQPEN